MLGAGLFYLRVNGDTHKPMRTTILDKYSNFWLFGLYVCSILEILQCRTPIESLFSSVVPHLADFTVRNPT